MRQRIYPALRAAFPVSIPVLAGYLFLGAGYGVLMNRIGYGPFWTAALSVLILGGTIQYVATGLLTLGFLPANAFIVSLLLNARHLFYGFSMLERYSGTGWKKPFLVFWLTDETFSLLCSDAVPEGADANWFRFFVSGLNYCYWIAGGLLGNAAGSLLAFNYQGIEFVMTSLFTVIVVGQWREARSRYPAVAGFGLSVLSVLLFGPDRFLIPAMILIIAALTVARSRLESRFRRDGGACA